jgi:hypothetical protein
LIGFLAEHLSLIMSHSTNPTRTFPININDINAVVTCKLWWISKVLPEHNSSVMVLFNTTASLCFAEVSGNCFHLRALMKIGPNHTFCPKAWPDYYSWKTDLFFCPSIWVFVATVITVVLNVIDIPIQWTEYTNCKISINNTNK